MVRAWAVANNSKCSAVAWLAGPGVLVTIMGVAQFSGTSVAVPFRRANAVTSADMVAAAKTDSAVGVDVTTTYVGGGKGVGVEVGVGVKVAVTALVGKGVGVPVVKTLAVANASIASTVAKFSGTDVGTMTK